MEETNLHNLLICIIYAMCKKLSQKQLSSLFQLLIFFTLKNHQNQILIFERVNFNRIWGLRKLTNIKVFSLFRDIIQKDNTIIKHSKFMIVHAFEEMELICNRNQSEIDTFTHQEYEFMIHLMDILKAHIDQKLTKFYQLQDNDLYIQHLLGPIANKILQEDKLIVSMIRVKRGTYIGQKSLKFLKSSPKYEYSALTTKQKKEIQIQFYTKFINLINIIGKYRFSQEFLCKM